MSGEIKYISPLSYNNVHVQYICCPYVTLFIRSYGSNATFTSYVDHETVPLANIFQILPNMYIYIWQFHVLLCILGDVPHDVLPPLTK